MFIWYVTGVCLALIIIAVVLLQNVYNFFEQYKIRIAIRKLHGYNLLSKYKEYLILLAVSWIIVITASFGISFVKEFASSNVILVFSAIGFVLETIISLIILFFIEKKKIIEFIKGGA
jgi:putative ABC transport system permease protein